MKKILHPLLLTFLLIVLFSCQTTESTPVPEKEEPLVIEEPQILEPVEEETIEPSEETMEVTEEVPEETTEIFVVTQEVFEETFVDIEELISDLNGIIRSKNYNTWTTYLTREYKEYYSDTQRLLEISQQPILKKYGIRLRSLKDYFEYVVVPSRSQAKLDDLVFIDNEHIHAIMMINGKRSLLYSLEKIEGKWKIGV